MYYENGQLRMRANYKNDELVRLFENYDQNGNDISNVRVVRETYQANGKLLSKDSYLGERYDGPSESYDEEGQLSRTTNYKDGVMHGLSSSYIDGQLFKTTNYKDGKMHGLSSLYIEGELYIKTCYQNHEKADMSYCEK